MDASYTHFDERDAMSYVTLLTFATLICFSALGYAADTSPRIKAIDQEVAQLKQQLHRAQHEEMETISEGQKYLVADWEKYAHEIQEARKSELKAEQIEQRIADLEQEKEQLIHQP